MIFWPSYFNIPGRLLNQAILPDLATYCLFRQHAFMQLCRIEQPNLRFIRGNEIMNSGMFFFFIFINYNILEFLTRRKNIDLVERFFFVRLFCFVLFLFFVCVFCLFCFVLFCFLFVFCLFFVLFCFVLFCFVLFLFCFVLFCFVLFCFVLFCFVLF